MSESFIPLAIPVLDDEDLEEIKEALFSGWITTGPKARKFEEEFAAMVGAKHGVAVNSCTTAMHLALEAAGIKDGDEVIVPTTTFASTANVVEHVRARPVLVDLLPDTLTVDPEAVERAITPKTRAMIPVHFAGHPCEMDRLIQIARKHNLVLIEDAAHAVPAKYKGRPVGGPLPIERSGPGLTSAACFSFYATKNLTTGEGGMICSEQEPLAERARIMSLHGISKDAWKRYSSEGSWYYEIQAPGFKYNLPDLLAAVGLVQLRKLPAFQRRRREIVNRYNAAFGELGAFECPVEHSHVEHAWHLGGLSPALERRP